MLVPGYFGEKDVKWVARIEVALDGAKGFYEQQGWGPDFIVPIRSRIDFLEDRMQQPLGEAANGVPLWSYDWKPDRPGDYHLTVARPIAKDRFRRETKSAQKLAVKPACIRSRCKSQPDRDAVAGALTPAAFTNLARALRNKSNAQTSHVLRWMQQSPTR